MVNLKKLKLKGWQREPARHSLAARGVKTAALKAKKRVLKLGAMSGAPGQILGELEFEYELLEDVMREYIDDANYYLAMMADGARMRGDKQLGEQIETGVNAISEAYSIEAGALHEKLDDFLNNIQGVPVELWDRANSLKMRMELASEAMGWFPPETYIREPDRSKVLKQIKEHYPTWKEWK
jgi:hypothetical protein